MRASLLAAMCAVIFAALAPACGGPAAPIAPRFVGIASSHRAKCGSCHAHVEPGEKSREQLERALSRHHKRVRLSDEDWALMVDYLAADARDGGAAAD